MEELVQLEKQIYLSVILPAYNEVNSVVRVVEKLENVLVKLGRLYEIIIIDDGSVDQTFEKVQKICKDNANLRIISFTRNFGKEAAILAGLQYCKGVLAVVMDCDLQHPPELILQMEKMYREQGVSVVHAVKEKRQTEHFGYRLFVGLFYKIMQYLSGYDLKNQSDYKMLDRYVVDAYINLPEKLRFFRGLIPWLGYKSAVVYFFPEIRVEGKSGWTSYKLFRMGIQAICSFSSIPLQMVTLMGLIMFVAGGVLGGQTLFMKINGNAVEGFTTVIILLLFIGSLIMISLGIIGEYLAMIYHEIKNRQPYIIKNNVTVQDRKNNLDIF